MRFWAVTRGQPLIAAMSVVTSAGYRLLLTFANTYVMGLIVDRIQASPVAAGGEYAGLWGRQTGVFLETELERQCARGAA